MLLSYEENFLKWWYNDDREEEVLGKGSFLGKGHPLNFFHCSNLRNGVTDMDSIHNMLSHGFLTEILSKIKNFPIPMKCFIGKLIFPKK